MRHDWIFDVLSDLQAYATAERLARLAAKVEETLDVARQRDCGRRAAGRMSRAQLAASDAGRNDALALTAWPAQRLRSRHAGSRTDLFRRPGRGL